MDGKGTIRFITTSEALSNKNVCTLQDVLVFEQDGPYCAYNIQPFYFADFQVLYKINITV